MPEATQIEQRDSDEEQNGNLSRFSINEAVEARGRCECSHSKCKDKLLEAKGSSAVEYTLAVQTKVAEFPGLVCDDVCDEVWFRMFSSLPAYSAEIRTPQKRFGRLPHQLVYCPVLSVMPV